MPKLQANGVNLHYFQTGQGPNVVMIHGMTGNLAIWHFTVMPGIRDDFRLMMFDLRGHGRSEMPPTGYTSRDMAEDLVALMDKLGIERTHLIGHSLGADIALHMAILYPERVDRIVAIEAGVAALVYLRKDEEWAGWAEWAKGIENYSGIKVPREKWSDVRYMLRACVDIPIQFGPARGLPRKREQLLALVEDTTLVKDYEEAAGMTLETIATIHNPVLLIYGDTSTYIGTYDALVKTLPNVRTFLLPGGDHFGILDRPQELIAPIRDFLLAPDEEFAPQMSQTGHA